MGRLFTQQEVDEMIDFEAAVASGIERKEKIEFIKENLSKLTDEKLDQFVEFFKNL
jgi:hypothetical protein